MRPSEKRLLAVAVAVFFGLGAVCFAFGQGLNDGPPVAGKDQAGGESPTARVKPRPAEIMRLAPQGMLLDIQRVDGGYVAVGDRGHILVSPDGEKWEQVPVPVRAMLTAVHFPDPRNGYAVGHDASILASRDGGKTWALQNFQPELEKPFLGVFFVDVDRGYAVGAYGLFYGTKDGGKTWTEVDSPIREEEVHLNAIDRLENGDLLLTGEEGMLAISSDEGATWARLESPYEFTLFGALPVGEKGALIYGLRGNVFMTADVRQGGWKALETHSVASLFGGSLLPDGRSALVGLNGVILLVDAAQSVSQIKSPKGTTLSAAVARNGNLLAVGDSGVQEISIQ